MGRKTVVCILSGGLDSAALLWKLLTDNYDVLCLTFDYGQRNNYEISAAGRLVTLAYETFGAGRVVWRVMDIKSMRGLIPSSYALAMFTGSNEPLAGHSPDLTIVPNRNMVFIALAAAYAIANGGEAVAYGPHAASHPVPPDCRPLFCDRMAGALAVCHGTGIELMTPFIYMTKAEILRLGLRLGAPIHETWSCYLSDAINRKDPAHCGKCGACLDRKEAHAQAGLRDTTRYQEQP